MKRALSFILLLAMQLSLCACGAASTVGTDSYKTASERKGQEYMVGDYKIRVFDDTRDAAIIYYFGSDVELTIPSELDGYPVTVIASGFCATTDTLFERVVLPETLKAIEKYAFSSQKKLKEINIPSGVTVLGEGAFMNCKSLTALDIPDEVAVIPDSLCLDCTKLENVKLPSALQIIEESAFSGCPLKNTVFPDGLIKISFAAFFGNAMTDVTLPSSMTELGDLAFDSRKDCEMKIYIPESVKKIGDGVVPQNAEIGCAEGSAAHKYACETGKKYRLI